MIKPSTRLDLCKAIDRGDAFWLRERTFAHRPPLYVLESGKYHDTVSTICQAEQFADVVELVGLLEQLRRDGTKGERSRLDGERKQRRMAQRARFRRVSPIQDTALIECRKKVAGTTPPQEFMGRKSIA